MIKVVNLISLIAAPAIVRIQGDAIPVLIAIAVLGGLSLWSVRQSKQDVTMAAEVDA
jgi:hypothetical protein